MVAEAQLCISKYHQKATAVEGDEISVEKNSQKVMLHLALPKSDKISKITGSKRESKAKR